MFSSSWPSSSLWGHARTAALALCAVLTLVAGRAQADLNDPANDEPPAVAVIPFVSQPPGRPAQLSGACEHALRRIKGLRVVGAVQWEKEAKESGQGDDLEAMARRLDARVLVTGSLSRRGQGWRLGIDLFDAQAQPLQSFELELLIPEVGPAAAFRLEEALARRLRPVLGLREKVEETVDNGPEPAPQSTDGESVVPLAEIEGIRPNAPAAKAVTIPPWRPLIEARLGLLVVGRTLGCGDTNAARLNLPCSDTLYPLDGGAGVRVDAALFPLARLSGLPKPLLGLGVAVRVDVPAWRERELTDGTSSSVRQLRFEAGLRWRWNIGDAVRRPILELGVGYGLHQFALGNDLVPYPDLEYQYLMPSLGIGAYLTPKLGVRVTGAFLAVLRTGEAGQAVDERNQNPFGPGGAFGFRVSAEGDYQLWRGLFAGVGGSFERFSLSFDGSGCTKSVPGQSICDQSIVRMTPPPPAVRSATDLHLALWLQLGYRY